MYTKVLLIIFVSLIASNLFATSELQDKKFFTVAPYIIVEDQGKLTLNFELSKDRKLDIQISSKSISVKTQKISGLWLSSKLNKIALGTLKCGEGIRYQFISKFGKTIDNSLYSIPCEENKSLYFGFMSDTQIKNRFGQSRANELSATVAVIKKSYPLSLIINAGDIVQNGGQEAEWTNFFNTASIYLSNSYLMAAVGNHEYYDAPTQDKAPPQFLKYMRNNDDENLGYMQLDLGKINLLMLNSNFNFMSESKIQEQWDWLEKKLINAEKFHKPTIIIMHHSPFSSSLEHVREIPTRLRNDLVPMLEKYKSVKMVISGHLHMYERSIKNGITYLIAGPSGGINNTITYKNPFSVFIKSLTTTFSVFNVTQDQIKVKTFDGSNKIVEEFETSLK